MSDQITVENNNTSGRMAGNLNSIMLVATLGVLAWIVTEIKTSSATLSNITSATAVMQVRQVQGDKERQDLFAGLADIRVRQSALEFEIYKLKNSPAR